MVRKIRLQDILRLLPLLLIYFAIWTWTSFYIVGMLLGYQHLTQLNEKQPPLPNDLAGLLLPYGHCGNDLDFSEKTIDVELTKLSLSLATASYHSQQYTYMLNMIWMLFNH